MKPYERVCAWLVAALLIFLGVRAVIFHRLPQGRGAYRAEPLNGPIAVVFGIALASLGLYFGYLLFTQRRRQNEEKSKVVTRKETE